MKVRQKWKSLTLCFLMLMTLLPLSSMTVRAEETLFEADNNGASPNEYNDSRPFHFVGEVFLLI